MNALATCLNAPYVRFRLAKRNRFDFAYEIELSDNGLRFVRVIENSRPIYLGIYKPEDGWVHLTNGSRFAADSLEVKTIRWFVGKLWGNRDADIAKVLEVIWEEGQ